MAQPPIRKIYTQDVVDGDGNVDGDRLLYPLNLFMESTYTLFDGDIQFGENIASQMNVITFTTESDYTSADNFIPVSYLKSMRKRPEGVVVLQTQVESNINTVITNPVTVHWNETTTGINISFVTGLDDSTAYSIRLLTI